MTAVFLQWDNTAPGNVTANKIYREPSNGPWTTPIATVAPTDDLYQDDAPGGTWWYRVTAENIDGESVDVGSNIDQITIVDTGPTVYMEDTFIGTNGDNVVGRVPDTVQNGAEVWTSNGSPAEIQSNAASTTAGSFDDRNGLHYAIPSADFILSFDVSNRSVGVQVGANFRNTETNPANFPSVYTLFWNGVLRLYEGGTQRGTVSVSDLSAGTHTVTATADAIDVRWDSASDTAVGFLYNGLTLNQAVPNVGFQALDNGALIDNFKAEAV